MESNGNVQNSMAQNTEIVPLFSTSQSLGDGGIFTVEKAGAAEKLGRKYGPVSLCDLAKQNDLKRIHIVETKLGSFMEAEKNLRSIGCAMHFGFKVVVCDDMNDKSEASLKTESNVIIWPAVDTETVYERFIGIASKAATDGFYYRPRIDWKTIKAMWSDDLLISLPFYSSFLAKNSLTFATISPDLPCKPLVHREVGQFLPFDCVINNSIDRYVSSTGAEVQNVKTVYYKRRRDSKQFQVYRCDMNGTKWDKPNMDHMSSSEFSWESYCELTGRTMK